MSSFLSNLFTSEQSKLLDRFDDVLKENRQVLDQTVQAAHKVKALVAEVDALHVKLDEREDVIRSQSQTIVRLQQELKALRAAQAEPKAQEGEQAPESVESKSVNDTTAPSTAPTPKAAAHTPSSTARTRRVNPKRAQRERSAQERAARDQADNDGFSQRTQRRKKGSGASHTAA